MDWVVSLIRGLGGVVSRSRFWLLVGRFWLFIGGFRFLVGRLGLNVAKGWWGMDWVVSLIRGLGGVVSRSWGMVGWLRGMVGWCRRRLNVTKSWGCVSLIRGLGGLRQGCHGEGEAGE